MSIPVILVFIVDISVVFPDILVFIVPRVVFIVEIAVVFADIEFANVGCNSKLFVLGFIKKSVALILSSILSVVLNKG